MPHERYHFKWLLSWLGNTNTTKVTKAQELSIEEQLAAGVRMFDLRPCASSASVKDLPIHHGISVLGDPPAAVIRRARPVGRSCRPSCFRRCSTASCVS